MTRGIMVRNEHNGDDYFKSCPAYKNIFQKVGWLTFCKNIQGYNMKVTRDFAEIFDGTKSQIGYRELTLSKDSMVVTIGF